MSNQKLYDKSVPNTALRIIDNSNLDKDVVQFDYLDSSMSIYQQQTPMTGVNRNTATSAMHERM